MSINSDISQLSEISMISCASSIQQLHPSSTTCKEYSLEKISNDLAKCEDTICQKAILELIFKCVESVSAAEEKNEYCMTMTPELLIKLRQVILANNIEKYLKLPSLKDRQNDDKLTILGIMNIPIVEFSRDEKKIIKSAVESELLNRIHSFLIRYEKFGGNLIETMGNNESIARQNLFKFNEIILPHWNNKINEMCNEYHRNIFICYDLLNEWQKLKHDDMEELTLKKAQSKLCQAQIAEIQAHLTKMTCAIKMFKEIPVTAQAFIILARTVEEKLSNIQAEIKIKKGLLKQYEDLRGTEYDDILRRYLDICSTIEKDERLLNSL
ncbi:hypothetical protein PV327_007306 [Microctonus hyperodae]|uniref:Uncharacterized protein n=1 Tax=Microctonus hyperodae TaxID=165561 RepID=A0AA39KJC3_MICHY|nr:hypothetical protein PV327_007306 [Microctonus hyperodae]